MVSRLPADVLVAVARFMPPEEMLTVRVCCQATNKLVWAHSHRWWDYLHACKSAPSTASRWGAIAAQVQMLQRDQSNPGLRWIFLNSSHIRERHGGRARLRSQWLGK